MIKDLRFNLFKEHMSKTTDKLLKEYDSFKGQNAVVNPVLDFPKISG